MNFFKKVQKHFQIKRRVKFVNKIFSDQTLEDYQKHDMLKLLDCINNRFNKPKKISCLDIGASANEINFISKYVKNVTGINISENYLKTERLSMNAKIIIMDGRKLKFPDNSFDFVYSINLYEHIHDISNSIDEQLRVVNKNGYCYASWYPCWSSARGHHVMDEMVKNWEKNTGLETQNYTNDGGIIKDWSHLIYSKEEMINHLTDKIKSDVLINIIVDFIYDSPELNRLFFDELITILSQKKLKIIDLKRDENRPPKDIREKLEQIYGVKDFSTEGCQLVFKKI